jgi:phosphatidylglycerol---prolipoprotein diacylglyceryl transferase
MTPIPFPNLSPDLFSVEIFGWTLALRWYALAYIAGIVIGLLIVRRVMNRPALWAPGAPPATPWQVEDLVTWMILGILIGGRLGFVLFYQPAYYLSHPWEIPMVWEGGMSFHGGFLGVVLATLWFARRHDIPVLPLGDAVALATPPGLFLGRVANFVNAELWGRPTTLPWAFAFPGEAAQDCPGVIGPCGRHPSQLYEAGLEGLVLGLLLWVLARRGGLGRPGLLTGTFLAVYGASRFLVEFVRQPDQGFVTDSNPLGLALHVGGYGLTMGQLLSLPMVAAGLWLVARARRRAPP